MLLRSTPHPTPTMPSGIVRPTVAQRLENPASPLSRSLEGENTFTFTELEGTDIIPPLRWNVEGQSVDFGRRWGKNMTHIRCAGRCGKYRSLREILIIFFSRQGRHFGKVVCH